MISQWTGDFWQLGINLHSLCGCHWRRSGRIRCGGAANQDQWTLLTEGTKSASKTCWGQLT